MRLEGKAALVTGAAAGFGREIARCFAREGARVVLADIDGAGAEAAAKELDGAIGLGGDVSKQADVARMVAAATSAFGHLDIVVNNAGVIRPKGPAEEVDESVFDLLMAVNVKSLWCMTRAAVPVMRGQGRGGAIVNIGSTGGLRPRAGLVWYNGTKGAVHAITKSLAAELAPDGIRVNAIAPVMGPTGMLESALGGTNTPEARQRVIDGIPLGRLCEPPDVANAALWLSEDTSAYITGIVVPVDGGRCI